jgi:hypothetical protein
MTKRGEVYGRASSADQEATRALWKFLLIANEYGPAHCSLHAVTNLGERLERTQGRLTAFQARVLLALYRVAMRLRADDRRSAIAPDGLAADDQARFQAACGTDLAPLADLFAALVAPRVRVAAGVSRMH